MTTQRPNQYTWVCPRCGASSISYGAPNIPTNCPTCNFPDQPPVQIEGANNMSDLEADVIPEEAAAARAAAEDPDAPPIPGITPAPVLQRGQTFSTGPYQFDTGWLAEVMRDEIGHYLTSIKIEVGALIDVSADMRLGDVLDLTALDWAGAAEQVAKKYVGERPTLLCGCPAGTHGRAMEEITRAHPERTT